MTKNQRIEPIKYQRCPHIETSQLIFKANQLAGFYMRATLAFNMLIKCYIWCEKLFVSLLIILSLPLILHWFERLIKSYYLLLACLKAYY